MDFICLNLDYLGLVDLISCPELFNHSSRECYI